MSRPGRREPRVLRHRLLGRTLHHGLHLLRAVRQTVGRVVQLVLRLELCEHERRARAVLRAGPVGDGDDGSSSVAVAAAGCRERAPALHRRLCSLDAQRLFRLPRVVCLLLLPRVPRAALGVVPLQDLAERVVVLGGVRRGELVQRHPRVRRPRRRRRELHGIDAAVVPVPRRAGHRAAGRYPATAAPAERRGVQDPSRGAEGVALPPLDVLLRASHLLRVSAVPRLNPLELVLEPRDVREVIARDDGVQPLRPLVFVEHLLLPSPLLGSRRGRGHQRGRVPGHARRHRRSPSPAVARRSHADVLPDPGHRSLPIDLRNGRLNNFSLSDLVGGLVPTTRARDDGSRPARENFTSKP